MQGIICKGIGGFYYIRAEDGNTYECKARGIFRKENIKPMIGDRVEIAIDGRQGSITAILPRRTMLVRPPVANIDVLILVAAAAAPEPNLRLLDKMLLAAEAAGIASVLCVNKTDLRAADMLRRIYTPAGYPIVEVSAKTEQGIDALLPYIQGKTAAFAGLSGVGKSSILNLLTGGGMETGRVSQKLQRGRHTTRHVELFSLDGGGFVLDTPGFSSFSVEDIPAGELWRYFPEMRDCQGGCRFKGCAHVNEPDCRVKEKLETGGIAPERYESYVEFYQQQKAVKAWEK